MDMEHKQAGFTGPWKFIESDAALKRRAGIVLKRIMVPPLMMIIIISQYYLKEKKIPCYH
jgi:hypothetical protein